MLRQDVEILDEKFDSFTEALTTLTYVIEESEVASYNEHLMEWADYCGFLKDRAHDTIDMLEGNHDNRNQIVQEREQEVPVKSGNGALVVPEHDIHTVRELDCTR